jgi:pyruvate/2-oxoglutarate dehydrogenase complex dihydrolipoamide dehydrogenase (E3) component
LLLEEPESSELVTAVFEAEGIGVRTGVRIERISHGESEFTVELDGHDDVVAERLLVATGRRADLEALGAASLGLDPSAQVLPVDAHMRVVPGVWAIGDVTGKGAFTHISMYQARIAYDDIVGRHNPGADYRALPRVTFTDPEIGSVGLSEAEARRAGINIQVGLADLAVSSRGWIHKAGNAGFIKLVSDADAGVLVGATSAGPCGGEVLGLLALAVHARVSIKAMRQMIYAYPTFHRAIEPALDDLH